jgi:hypothetical protein
MSPIHERTRTVRQKTYAGWPSQKALFEKKP